MLEDQFAERAATEPELLAYHFTEAGLIDRAIEGLANVEAIGHLNKTIGVLLLLCQT